MLVRFAGAEQHANPYSGFMGLAESSLDELNDSRFDEILRVVRRILSNEAERDSHYIGLNIYTEGSKLFYAQTQDGRQYLEFASPKLANLYYNVLVGILLLGLTRFHSGEAPLITEKVNDPNPLPVGQWGEAPFLPRPYMGQI